MLRVMVRPNDREFRRTLRNIRRVRSPGKRRQIVRPGVNAAASALNKDMKRRAKTIGTAKFISRKRGLVEITGKELSRSIGVRRKTYARNNWVIAVVGPRFTYRMPNGFQPSAVAVFIEGLKPNDGLETPPTPFARRSAALMKRRMIRIFRQRTEEAAKKTVAKLRAGGPRV